MKMNVLFAASSVFFGEVAILRPECLACQHIFVSVSCVKNNTSAIFVLNRHCPKSVCKNVTLLVGTITTTWQINWFCSLHHRIGLAKCFNCVIAQSFETVNFLLLNFIVRMMYLLVNL